MSKMSDDDDDDNDDGEDDNVTTSPKSPTRTIQKLWYPHPMIGIS